MNVEVNDIVFDRLALETEAIRLGVENPRANIVGIYREVSVDTLPVPFFGVEGEYIRFEGITSSGQRVEAYYVGGTGSAGVSAAGGFNLGYGVFSFTGDVSDFGGFSVSSQISSGFTAGLAVNVDGSGVLAFGGANFEASANIGAGFTYRIDVDGVFLEQTITSTSAGRGELRLTTVEQVVDADGNRVSAAEAAEYGVRQGQFDRQDFGIETLEALGTPRCFLAGTPISMWDGSEKPIEEIAPDDWVTSYDEDGKLVPGRVTRTFQNQSKHILNLFGLMVTPGHATFCAEGRFAGRHVPIIDILRSDGVLMREDGTMVRAATGCELDSHGDQMIWAVVGEKADNGKMHMRNKAQIRLGTRFIMDDGRDVCLLDLITRTSATITQDGFIQRAEGAPKLPFHWRFTNALPKPEDYILQRSQVSLEAIYQEGSWEAIGPQLPAPAARAVFPRDNKLPSMFN